MDTGVLIHSPQSFLRSVEVILIIRIMYGTTAHLLAVPVYSIQYTVYSIQNTSTMQLRHACNLGTGTLTVQLYS
eukprot:COSAG02_NODE_576_length_20112_cov_13.577625_9_plen_74_part_00